MTLGGMSTRLDGLKSLRMQGNDRNERNNRNDRRAKDKTNILF